MKVLDTYRPEPGLLALLLKCRCVATLRGHRGRAPSEHPCRKHDEKSRTTKPRKGPSPTSTMPAVAPAGRARRSVRRRPDGQGERTQVAPPPTPSPTEDRGLSAGAASPTATPISASSSVERSSASPRPTDEAGDAPKVNHEALGSSDVGVSMREAERVGEAVRARRRGEEAGVGYVRLREMELQVEACVSVRKAVVVLARTHRTQFLDPKAYESAIEEVLRAAQVAGWLDPDRDAKASLGREQGPTVPRRTADGGRRTADGGRRTA